MTTLTVNHADTYFSVSSAGGGGNYPKALFEPHVDFQSVFVRNTTDVSQMPFMVLANIRTSYYQNTIIVDGITYQVDYTSSETIAATLEVMYLVLANAFNGVESNPENAFEFTSAPSFQDFATALGITLIFPSKNDEVITFWNKDYAIPVSAFQSGNLIVASTLTTDIGQEAFFDNSALIALIADSTSIIRQSAFASCPVLNETSFLSVKEIEGSAFVDCTAKQDFIFPSIERITGDLTFKNCAAARDFTFGPNLTQLGTSTGDNGTFSGITGNTITVTIPILFQTIDGGNMAGDLVYLDTNNTVTFKWI